MWFQRGVSLQIFGMDIYIADVKEFEVSDAQRLLYTKEPECQHRTK